MKRLAHVALSVNEAFSGNHGTCNIGLVDLGHVEELDKTQGLGSYIAWNRDRRRVDHPISQTLDQKTHLVELNKCDVPSRDQGPDILSIARARASGVAPNLVTPTRLPLRSWAF